MIVRILTYNIHHGTDARNHPSLDRIGDLIAESNASIVCLQEVDRNYGPRSGHADQVVDLANRLDMHNHFGAAISRRGGHYGNAILTAGTMSQARVHRLPTPEGAEPRCAASATVSTDAGPVHVISTHLTVGLDMGTVRRCQVAALADIAAASPLPTIVAGDFNTGARRTELADLEQVMHNAARAGRWTPARLGLLWGRPHAATFPVRQPWMRIDRIYVTGLRVHRVRVLPGDASDHRAMMAEVDLG